MALDFPLNPTNGQIYDNYYWDAAAGVWNSLGNYAIPNILSNATFTASTATSVPVTVQGVASQSANLQNWKDSSGNVVASIGSGGKLNLTSALDVPYGGTGATSLTYGSYLKGNGTGSITPQTGVPATDLTGTINYSSLPSGTVIQVVNTKYTPLTTTSSTSFVNFTTATFTPKLSTSKVLIQAMFSTSNGGAIQVRNNAGTAIYTPPVAYHVFAGVGGPDYGASTIRIPYFLQCTDTPGTTATRTYYFDFRVYSGTFGINEAGSGVSSITFTEFV